MDGAEGGDEGGGVRVGGVRDEDFGLDCGVDGLDFVGFGLEFRGVAADEDDVEAPGGELLREL